MAMCKECGEIVGANDIENGICKSCITKGVIVEPVKNNTITKKEVVISNFGNPFSFIGKSERLDYLAYGIFLPYAILGLGYYVAIITENSIMFLLSLLLGVIIAIAATVRRTRDRGENIILVAILAMVPYLNVIVMLYLLLAPSKKNENIE